MISLLLDQASRKVGFAVLDTSGFTMNENGVLNGRIVQHGLINTPPKAGLLDRLKIIEADIRELITVFKPSELVVENTMFVGDRGGNNAAILKAIHTLCNDLAKEFKIPFYRQHPNTIKKTTTGYGNADKADMIEAVCKLWNVSKFKIIDDNHADALAAAYCWLFKAEEIRAK